MKNAERRYPPGLAILEKIARGRPSAQACLFAYSLRMLSKIEREDSKLLIMKMLPKDSEGRDGEFVERLSWWMDEAFQIPGTKFRVGWDAILGLFPGLGEAITLIIQCFIIFMS